MAWQFLPALCPLWVISGYAVQKAMSALPLIAIAKADFRNLSCPFSPKADMCGAIADVSYGPKSGHQP